MTNTETFWILLVFFLGYGAIIGESLIKVNKGASALLIAALSWVLHLHMSASPHSAGIAQLGHHVLEIAQILFFLMGAMTLVELIDSHQGFKILTDRIHTRSKRTMLWVLSFAAFFLSAVLDNLTTTILMVSLMRKIIPQRSERLLLGCMIVVAANAGGAWTPIGDITTTMLWINGQLSSGGVMKALLFPSLVALLVPLLWFTFRVRGKFEAVLQEAGGSEAAPGSVLVLILGIAGLIFVPVFKALTGLPPFMGVALALGVLWLVTDLMHHKHEERGHLRVPHILTRVDTSGILFFLGILLAVGALQAAGILQALSSWLDGTVGNQTLIASFIGVFSALIDNVPLVAATMEMYSYPIDASFWHMVAYAAGTGGSILIIGSSSGVALMGLEKVDFLAYARKVALPALIGFLAGMAVYLLFS